MAPPVPRGARGRRRRSMRIRGLLLMALVVAGPALAQAPPAVPYPRDYKTKLVKYATVDRSDGLSRDLYASPGAIEALKRDEHLREFPVGVLLALDVHGAKALGRDRKSG